MGAIFDNIEETLKKIAKFLFFLLLIGGVLILLIGLIKVIGQCDEYTPFSEIIGYTIEDYTRGVRNGYEWYVEGYKGKVMMSYGFCIAISCFAVLPLYGFGVLIEKIKDIEKEVIKLRKMSDENDTLS